MFITDTFSGVLNKRVRRDRDFIYIWYVEANSSSAKSKHYLEKLGISERITTTRLCSTYKLKEHSYFDHRQNYFLIEGNFKIILFFKDRKTRLRMEKFDTNCKQQIEKCGLNSSNRLTLA